MAVDTTIRFGRYNSYELAVGEELWSSKFDVDLYGQIAIQLQAIRIANTATGQLIVRWLKADGGKLSDSTKSIDIMNKWKRETWIVDVPAGAVKAMWAIKNTHGSRTWNFACGMVEPGPVAGAFDPALANLVSLMTTDGLYTGTVYASQVLVTDKESLDGALTAIEAGQAAFVKYTDIGRPTSTVIDGGNVMTGKIKSADGKMEIDLDNKTMKMEGATSIWKASTTNPLVITDKAGNIIGGIATIDGELSVFVDKLTNSPTAEFYLKTGSFPFEGKTFHGVTGKKTGTAAPMFSMGSSYNAIEEFGLDTPIVAMRALAIPMSGGIWMPAAGLVLQDKTEKAPSYLRNYIGSWSKISMTPFWGTFTAGKSELRIGNYFAETPPREVELGVHAPDTDSVIHAVGADATGPYYIAGNTKSYHNSVDLPAGTNLNTLVTPGVYYTGTGVTNKPSSAGDYAMVEVVRNSATFVTQYYIDGDGNAWIRRMHAGSWTAWKQMT